mgnify:CR=1 FL=1
MSIRRGCCCDDDGGGGGCPLELEVDLAGLSSCGCLESALDPAGMLVNDINDILGSYTLPRTNNDPGVKCVWADFFSPVEVTSYNDACVVPAGPSVSRSIGIFVWFTYATNRWDIEVLLPKAGGLNIQLMVFKGFVVTGGGLDLPKAVSNDLAVGDCDTTGPVFDTEEAAIFKIVATSGGTATVVKA